MENKVIDFKTRKALFNEPIRVQLQQAVSPHLVDAQCAPQVVDTVEQVICTTLVAWGRDLACRAAAKIAAKITSES